MSGLNDALRDLAKMGIEVAARDAKRYESKLEKFSTGLLSLDYILGGGYPKGRIIEIFGWESCIAADTYVKYYVIGPDGKVRNNKGGTIEDLYHRFKGIPRSGSGKYSRPGDDKCTYAIAAINDQDCVFANPVLDVVKCGNKVVYELTTADGKTVVATADHKFYVGGGKYKRLGDLRVGSTVFSHNNTPNTRKHKTIRYAEVYVKNHPNWPIKRVAGRYYYRRGRVCEAVVEAKLNNMSYTDYISLLNTRPAEAAKVKTIPPNCDVHHINSDYTDDSAGNLVVLTKTDHYRLHAIKNHNNLRFKVVPTKVTRIRKLGTRMTYDIKCPAPNNNYIANGIVVHNSGKSTLCLLSLAAVQRSGGVACLVDAEHAFDPEWAAKMGIDADKLLVAQPSSGEQALQVLDKLAASGEVQLIVVDSLAAMTPEKELEGEIGDAQVGTQARMMSQGLRRLTATAAKSNTTIIFINQLRHKVGVMYGNPETTPGGMALKFYASLRFKVSRKEKLQASKDSPIIGHKVKIDVVKTKVSQPYLNADFDMLFTGGIDQAVDAFNVALAAGVITKDGNSYMLGGDKLAVGYDAALDVLRSDPGVYESVRDKVSAAITSLKGTTVTHPMPAEDKPKRKGK